MRCLLVHHEFKVHHADHLVGILNDVSRPGLASHHQQNARVGVVKAHKHQWRSVTLLVAEGEVLEVKPMWRIVKNVSHVFPVCCSLWIKTKHSFVWTSSLWGTHKQAETTQPKPVSLTVTHNSMEKLLTC